MNNSPFERTTCACSDCVGCCHRQPGPLAPGDLERIAAFRGESVEEATKNFWASPGALVKDGAGTTSRVGTITPKLDRRKKRCVFLDDNDRSHDSSSLARRFRLFRYSPIHQRRART